MEIKPPAISPVSDPTNRPLWSVMIPTYNCANFLRETLQSVFAQDPGPQTMQIEVVDDCSTKDDPEAVVRELSPTGRVAFFRQPRNQGAIGNFNTCIQRSKGTLIHILHGDDIILDGFYDCITRAHRDHPKLSAYFSRGYIIDDQGSFECLTPRSKELESPCNSSKPLWHNNCIATPAAVITREFYETMGGFLPQLCHVADWEMWCRALDNGGGLLINRPLAAYRHFATNDTSRLAASGDNLKDYVKLAGILTQRHNNFDPTAILSDVGRRGWIQSNHFRTARNMNAARENYKIWLKYSSATEILSLFLSQPRPFLGHSLRVLKLRQ